MLDIRASRRGFLKGLTVLAGVSVLPVSFVEQPSNIETPRTIALDTPLTSDLLADDRIWLDFDGKRHQLDVANISMRRVTKDISFDTIYTRPAVLDTYCFLDCHLTDKFNHVAYLNQSNSNVVYPITIHGKYGDSVMRVTGKAKITSPFSGADNLSGLTLTLGNDNQVSEVPLRFLLVQPTGSKNLLKVELVS